MLEFLNLIFHPNRHWYEECVFCIDRDTCFQSWLVRFHDKVDVGVPVFPI